MSVFDPDAFDAFEEAGWAAKEPEAYDALPVSVKIGAGTRP